MGVWEYALTSLAAQKSYLGITVSSHDSILESFIDAVSRACENFCGTHLKKRSAAITEYHDGEGGTVLVLDNLPIISVTSIHEDTDRDFGTDTLIDADDYVWEAYKEQGLIKRDDQEFEIGIGSIKVIYTAGYQTIPDDLELACWKWVGHVFNEHKDKRWGLESLGSAGETTRYIVGEPPKDVRALLAKFKKPKL